MEKTWGRGIGALGASEADEVRNGDQNALEISELILAARRSFHNAGQQPETLIDPECLGAEDNCLCQGWQSLGEAPQSERKVGKKKHSL